MTLGAARMVAEISMEGETGMINGLYHSASALAAAQNQHEIIAENIANAATPGYRRQGLVFSASAENEAAGSDPAAGGVRGSRPFLSHESGPIQRTGNPFDFALGGNAYFAVQSADGPVYTRNGAMNLSPSGEIQTVSGLPVLGADGPIRIPTNAGRVEVMADGTVLADNVNVGRFRIVTFPDSPNLRRVGPTLYDVPNAQNAPPDSYRVEQGFREGSNVQVVHEMVAMMLGMRHYEASEKAMKALNDAIGFNTTPR